MNVLKREKQIQAVSMLAEGSSIRSVERMTGIHRDTVMRLGVRIGNGCINLMDAKMRGLGCQYIEVDEAWTFVGKKQRNLEKGFRSPIAGDFWVWLSLDPVSKLVPTFRVGKRTKEDAKLFIADLARRVSGRIQISSDALSSYVDAIEQAFGGDVDYGQIVKTFESEPIGPGRYSPPQVTLVEKLSIEGAPNMARITTSHCEKLNHTMRMHVRRMSRLTNAFSKKPENLRAGVGLFYGYYNFVRMHKAIRMTPAMKAGVTSKLWSLADLVDEAEAHC
jgi:IS1 family transposase